MSDLIKRLRDQQTKFMTPILGEAADALERMRWQPIETAGETPSRPCLGSSNGVSYSMKYVHELAITAALGIGGYDSGWYAFANGLICFSGNGEPIQVFPTKWMHLPHE